jgi:hypothetical protein
MKHRFLHLDPFPAYLDARKISLDHTQQGRFHFQTGRSLPASIIYMIRKPDVGTF